MTGGSVEAIVWKFHRLRAMGLAEALYRFRQVSKARFERLGFGLATTTEAPRGSAGMPWLEIMPLSFDSERYCAAADRVLRGYYHIFALDRAELGFPPQWNRDPKTGTEAPMVFGKNLNYRDEGVVGDIKYLWEPNRHLELVTLAQAWHLSREARYLESSRQLLESWFLQCPYPVGPNWVSSLEHAIRLVNWSYTWHLLDGDDSPLFHGDDGADFRRRWLDSIYQHLHFIRGYLSRYSSANNHLMGEYMGLFVGAVTWPLWRECREWLALAKEGLETEALRQNAEDGVNREQAAWYHHEVADMLFHCAIVGRANGIEFSRAYWGRLEAMLEYLASIMDLTGNVPMFGDADDAVMVRFSQEPEFNAYRSLLATGAVLFERSDFKVKAGRLDDKTRWLLGDAAEEKFNNISLENMALPVSRQFPSGGYWVLGDKFETDQEIRIVADAGPLGYLSIAAHGHADALSFTLSVKGREILIDSGTYAYHTQKKWRDYFRGTSAHNTVRVDGADQSIAGGNFLWIGHAEARCEKYITETNLDEWQASHDGYLKLDKPVRHRRRILLDKVRREIEVIDQLEGAGEHAVEIFWHFAESCKIRKEADDFVVLCEDIELRVITPVELQTDLMCGSESPPLGWISRRYDEKKPITSLVCNGRVGVDVTLRTLIRINDVQVKADLQKDIKAPE